LHKQISNIRCFRLSFAVDSGARGSARTESMRRQTDGKSYTYLHELTVLLCCYNDQKGVILLKKRTDPRIDVGMEMIEPTIILVAGDILNE
jgi:hypothetical protein